MNALKSVLGFFSSASGNCKREGLATMKKQRGLFALLTQTGNEKRIRSHCRLHCNTDSLTKPIHGLPFASKRHMKALDGLVEVNLMAYVEPNEETTTATNECSPLIRKLTKAHPDFIVEKRTTI